jgi:hypothetical protein
LRARGVLLVSLAAFWLLHTLAAFRYSGGTWSNPASPGYAFWDNYLCDVATRTALNGSPNPGFAAGVASFGFLVILLMALWWVMAILIRRRAPRLAAAVIACGALSCLGVVLIVAFPGTEGRVTPHFFSVLVAAGAGLAATFIPVGCFLANPEQRRLGAWCVLLSLPAVAAIGVYAGYHLGGFSNQLVSVLQKLSVASVSAMALACAAAVRRAAA